MQSIVIAFNNLDDESGVEGPPSEGKEDSLMLTLTFKTRKVQKKKACEKFRSMIKRSPEKVKHHRKQKILKTVRSLKKGRQFNAHPRFQNEEITEKESM